MFLDFLWDEFYRSHLLKEMEGINMPNFNSNDDMLAGGDVEKISFFDFKGDSNFIVEDCYYLYLPICVDRFRNDDSIYLPQNLNFIRRDVILLLCFGVITLSVTNCNRLKTVSHLTGYYVTSSSWFLFRKYQQR